MNIRLSIDRFEGMKKEMAVLVTDDGRSILFPRNLLPKGSKAGDLLTMSLERDGKGMAEMARKAKALRESLAETDPGGDIQL